MKRAGHKSIFREVRLSQLRKGAGYGRNISRAHRERLNPECRPEDSRDRVGRTFAADTHGNALLPRGIYRHCDEFRDGGIERLIKVGNGLIAAIRRHGILNEVIGAQREEVANLG